MKNELLQHLHIPPYLFSMYNHSFNFLYLFFYFVRTPYIRMRMCAHNHDVPLTLNKLQWPRTGNTGTLLPGLSWSHMRAESRGKAQNTGKVSCYYQARGSSSNGFFPWPCSTFLSIYGMIFLSPEKLLLERGANYRAFRIVQVRSLVLFPTRRSSFPFIPN